MKPAPLPNLSADSIADWNAVAPDERLLDVSWFLPPDRHPEQNVRLVIGDGRLQDIVPLPLTGGGTVLPLAVVPPLVNVHTHLEFSDLERPLTPAQPFPDWIRSVILWRQSHPDTESQAIARGLAESKSSGISLLGEITTSDSAVDQLEQSQQAVVSFRELLGILPDRISGQIDVMERHLNRVPENADGVSPGISPHSPYSVHPELFSAAVDACQHGNVPLTVHLAETRDELELLDRATGRFVDFLQEMNLWDRSVFEPGRRPMFYLEQLARVPRSLAIHGNYLADDEIRFLGNHPQIAVVYCPRTHGYFDHDEHPWKKIIAAGGTVVLGTDGRSSNPDLSIWKELQFVARQPESLPIPGLVPLITTTARRALGFPAAGWTDPDWAFHATLIWLGDDGDPSLESLLSPASGPIGTLSSKNGRVVLESL